MAAQGRDVKLAVKRVEGYKAFANGTKLDLDGSQDAEDLDLVIRETKRCASIDLPEPGGPSIKRLCPPAAAISSALRAPVWPFTSDRSGPG